MGIKPREKRKRRARRGKPEKKKNPEKNLTYPRKVKQTGFATQASRRVVGGVERRDRRGHGLQPREDGLFDFLFAAGAGADAAATLALGPFALLLLLRNGLGGGEDRVDAGAHPRHRRGAPADGLGEAEEPPGAPGLDDVPVCIFLICF